MKKEKKKRQFGSVQLKRLHLNLKKKQIAYYREFI